MFELTFDGVNDDVAPDPEKSDDCSHNDNEGNNHGTNSQYIPRAVSVMNCLGICSQLREGDGAGHRGTAIEVGIVANLLVRDPGYLVDIIVDSVEV